MPSLYWLQLFFCTYFSGSLLFGCSDVHRTSAAEARYFLIFCYTARLNVVPFPVSLPDSADQIHHSLE
ncbi:MAG: hypothetical protein WCC89_08465, partial [Candidatus Sulfotelmatobacter sp.]